MHILNSATTFDEALNQLPAKQRQVLSMILKGKTDSEIAERLKIQEGTVRTHLAKVCHTLDTLGLTQETNERRSRRAELVNLFAKYKPELISHPNNPTETSDKHMNTQSSMQEEIPMPRPPIANIDDDDDLELTIISKVRLKKGENPDVRAVIAQLENILGKTVKLTFEINRREN